MWHGGNASCKRSLLPIFPLTYADVEISPRSFWLSFLTLLPHWFKVSRPHLVPVPNYWTWTKSTPQENCFFFCQILIKLRLWYFIHRNDSVTLQDLQCNLSHVIKVCWWYHGQNYDIITCNIFILKRPRVANFADIIKIAATFIKTIIKDS